GTNRHSIDLWDPATGKKTATLKGHSSTVKSVAFSPDGKTLASASADKTVKLWDVATGNNTATLGGNRSQVHCVAVSPDGKTVASAGGGGVGEPGELKLWDVGTGKLMADLSARSALAISAVAFSPDGKTLASAGQDALVHLWDVATQKQTAVLKGHAFWV